MSIQQPFHLAHLEVKFFCADHEEIFLSKVTDDLNNYYNAKKQMKLEKGNNNDDQESPEKDE